MADIIRFTDPDDDSIVRLDVSNYIAGEVPPNFGIPTSDRRLLSFQLDLHAASKAALITLWQNVAREVERGSSLEIRLEGSASSVWFDIFNRDRQLRRQANEERSTVTPIYDWITGAQHFMAASLELVCDPYARGAEETPVNAVAVENFTAGSVDILAANVKGDVPAPARVQFDVTDSGAAAQAVNRLVARIYRRSVEDLAEFDHLYLPADISSLGGATTIEGDEAVYTPTSNTWQRVASWNVVGDAAAKRTGLFDVYAWVKDYRTTPGSLALRADFSFPDLQEPVRGRSVTIIANTAHDAGQNSELWRLGTFQVPASPQPPAAYVWHLYAFRSSSLAIMKTRGLVVVPVDESVGILDWTAEADISAEADGSYSFDTEKRAAWWGSLTNYRAPASLLGSGLYLQPGVDNRLIVHSSADMHAAAHNPPGMSSGQGVTALTVKYRPRYLFVR